ncbi:MAG TPA: hypothetical protein VGX25_31390 [Actinophytocola sp.]|uniref:hypothetical protein n=1 Tax=Actinophytocola sp. TaxID=1872138 RepID=UPI002DDD1574|nr:hypothetical protein [Actinophytocola sp.]HEV2783914.1 hypothetical protein [Actinophytocola sp.]
MTGYTLDVSPGSTVARLADRHGTWAGLRLLAAVDTVAGRDETTWIGAPEVDGRRIRLTHGSSRWGTCTVVLDRYDDRVETWVEVSGRGRITDVFLLSGRGVAAGHPLGWLPSAAHFTTLFSANPADPARILIPATESAVIGVCGDGQPGRGHWFFTPAPLYYAVRRPAGGPWLGLGLTVPVEEATFTGWHYLAADGGFAFRLDYEGQTEVDGQWRSPTLVLRPGLADPYAGLRRHGVPRPGPDWWREPMFCGWGAQCHLATVHGGRAAEQSTRRNYDAFLDHLARHGVRPGTVVVDDNWQRWYCRPDPDPARWPDLRGWIADRHRAGQRVLLWWKAWDPTGAPPEVCVRDPAGNPVALDPDHPGAVELLTGSIRAMLSADGLDADGLKIDFTAATPTGTALSHRGPRWGLALLHELLAVIYRAAKAAKPDALVVTQTPHPAFLDVTDMVRLNDILRLDDPHPRSPVVEAMTHRAAIVRAACPEVLIDTDDWCAPDLAGWRAYRDVKPTLGVPALYYTTHLDYTGESISDEDLVEVGRIWAEYRAGPGYRGPREDRDE